MEERTKTLTSHPTPWIAYSIIYCLFLSASIQADDANISYDGLSDTEEGIIPSLAEDSFDFGLQPVISDPLFEEIDPKIAAAMDKRRDLSDGRLSNKTKIKILELHNMYRGNVTPPAGDMQFLEWDDQLEHLAQLWSNGCVFEHGKPPNTSYPATYGQNLYKGDDPTGVLGLWLWYEEYLNYNFHNRTCEPFKKCGHYITMAWAKSNKLGCAMTLCGLRYIMVCHYSPSALKGVPMYDVSKPCSQCFSKPKTLCYNNLCMTEDQCKRHPKECESAKCNLKCHNCGRLNETMCQCECADGWDSSDCSRLCGDAHDRCYKKPGYPNKATCSWMNHTVANTFCRKMCQKCNPIMEDAKVNHICCDGRLCPDGYVLDLGWKLCRCIKLCPGPLCDDMEGSGVIIINNAALMTVLMLISYLLHKNFNTF